jgi:hypothetical protein
MSTLEKQKYELSTQVFLVLLQKRNGDFPIDVTIKHAIECAHQFVSVFHQVKGEDDEVL